MADRTTTASLLAHLGALLPDLTNRPELQASVDASFESLYSLQEGEPEALAALSASWPPAASAHPALRPWQTLVALVLAATGDQRAVLDRLAAELNGASRWTALLVGCEAARLAWNTAGAARAWEFANAVGAVDGLRATSPVTAQRIDGSLFQSACCVLLELAALNGAWERFDAVRGLIPSWPPEERDAALRIGLVEAEAALLRGKYQAALDGVRRALPSASDGLRFHLRCVELHALVALGAGAKKEAAAVVQALLAEHRRAGVTVAESRRRSARLLALRQVVSRNAELADVFAEVWDGTPLPAPTAFEVLFAEEWSARRDQNEERRRGKLLAVLERTEAELLREDAAYAPEGALRLRLLWCRLVVDAAEERAFAACATELTAAIEEAKRLQARPLEMLAHDQRGVLRTRLDPPDWTGAAQDRGAAATIALELLDENAPGGLNPDRRRVLLESLLPILDRSVETYAQGAERLKNLPGFSLQLGDAFDPALFVEESPRGSWQRFGRALHAQAEQAQALALEEARRARDLGEPLVASASRPGEAPLVLDQLRDRLRDGDAVVQYFLVGAYLLVFTYGRAFFHWHLESVDEAPSSDAALERLIERLRGWTQGESHAKDSDLVRLRAMLLPPRLVEVLTAAKVRHLRVVPHGALYRVPFGRLETSWGALSHCFSMSLHPTGSEAVASAPAAVMAPRRRVAHVVGPETRSIKRPVSCGLAENAAMTTALGRFFGAGTVRSIEGWRDSLAGVTRALQDSDVLHFTCHGQEGNALGQQARMLVTAAPAGELDARAIARLKLDRRPLVVLQSCWTGWMDHKRSHPVQGVPQAFCDAGAAAVIAPLTQVPIALAATFTTVFYKALRFLPAEVALRRALSVLRKYATSVARLTADRDALAHFASRGHGFDALEYRYTGLTGVRLGNVVSRAVGRLSFWLFEKKLARRSLPHAPVRSGPARPQLELDTPGKDA